MASDRHAQRMGELIADAEAKGGRVIAAGDGAGRRIALRIVTGVRDDMRIAQEEIFGPILPIMTYDSLDDAIEYVNSRPRPLGFYVFGLNDRALASLKRRTHAGGMSINDWGWHAFNHDLPFGGVGNSGMGSYHGVEGFRELSHAKAVYRRHRFFPVGLFYPPYGGIVPRLAMRMYLGKANAAAPVAGRLPGEARSPG